MQNNVAITLQTKLYTFSISGMQIRNYFLYTQITHLPTNYLLLIAKHIEHKNVSKKSSMFM